MTEHDALIELSLRGLERMWDPADETLYSVTFERGTREVDRHLGVRYTVMSSLGVHDAIQSGRSTTLDPARLLRSGLARHPTDDIDHLGMALWADAFIGAGVADAVLPRLLTALDGDLGGVIGRQLAWALTGLALHPAARDDARARAAARRLRDLAMGPCWNPGGRLFNHKAAGGFMRTQALFSTQIYWVYALATYGRLADDPEAVEVARQCAHTLIALCDDRGGWPWRFDAPRGRVTERYPIYAVHQDAMAPMALRALSQACGDRFEATIAHSLSWIHQSELGDLVDPVEQVIFRAIRRRYPLNRGAYRLGWGLALLGQPSPLVDRPFGLRINRTCRPYHLGWVLHAWCHPWGAA